MRLRRVMGVVPVASAGNSGKEDPFYPAYNWNVIAVAATDHNDAKAKFSNYDGLVDVAGVGTSAPVRRFTGSLSRADT